jgi:hypothetical protein
MRECQYQTDRRSGLQFTSLPVATQSMSSQHNLTCRFVEPVAADTRPLHALGAFRITCEKNTKLVKPDLQAMVFFWSFTSCEGIVNEERDVPTFRTGSVERHRYPTHVAQTDVGSRIRQLTEDGHQSDASFSRRACAAVSTIMIDRCEFAGPATASG